MPSRRRTISSHPADVRANTRCRRPRRLAGSDTVARTTKKAAGMFLSLNCSCRVGKAQRAHHPSTTVQEWWARCAFAHPTHLPHATVTCSVISRPRATRYPRCHPCLSAIAPPLLSALWLLTATASRPAARHRAAARAADRAAAVLSGRQDEGRAAEATAQPMHRAVSQDRFFHRPPRRSAGIPRTYARSPI